MAAKIKITIFFLFTFCTSNGQNFYALLGTKCSPPSAITGTLTVASSSTTQLSNTTPGGTWTSTTTTIATVGTAGLVTGVSAGTSTISYCVTGGCCASVVVTVTSSGGGTIVFKKSVFGNWSNVSPSDVVTAPVDMTGVNLIVFKCTYFGASDPTSITDSKGNTYIKAATISANNMGVGVYYCYTTNVGSAMTFEIQGTDVNAYVTGFGGTVGSVYDKKSSSTATATTLQPGSVTPSFNNEVVVSIFGSFNANAGGAPTVNSGMTITNANAYNNTLQLSGGAAYIIQSAAASLNETWNNNNAGTATNLSGINVTFP